MELPGNISITDRYIVQELLGQGSMGQVLKCKDSKLKRTVAVKRILKDLDNDSVARFHHEAKVTSQLEHENILKIYDFGQADDGQLFMVMEILDGSSLRDLISIVGAIGFRDAYPIFIQICDGLSYAHSKGVLHRDIKPSNVILLEQKNDVHKVKLVDFGLAKVSKELDPRITKTGLAVGSPAYMSPEQALGREIDLRSDIYNFGCTLFQTLTGKTVFGSENPTEILNRQVRDKPPLLSEMIDKEFDPSIESFVAKCLAKRPDDRYSSVEEMKEALTHAMDSLDLELESESSINQAIYDKSKFYYKVLAVLMVSVFAIGMGYFMYVYLERKDATKPSNAHKISGYNDSGTQTPMRLGDAITKSYGFRIKQDPEGLDYIDAVGEVKDIDLKKAAEKFKDTQIGLWNVTHSHELTGSGFKYLEDLPVRELRLSKTSINDDGCKQVARIKSLQRLAINRCDSITPKGLAFLSELPKLNTLAISGAKLSSREAFENMAKIKSLDFLKISQVKLTGDEIEPLTKLKNLNIILFRQSTVPKAAFAVMAKIEGLESIVLHDTKFSSEGIVRLKTSRVKDIDIAKSQIDESTMEALAKIKSLRLLNFRSTNVTRKDVRNLTKANPQCEIFVE